jgi:hypothetical protein
MGCVVGYEKEDKEDIKEISISISELSYIEPIKTIEQQRIEYIQNIFKVEYKKKNIKYIYK